MSVHKNKNNNTWYVKYKNKTKRGFKSKHEAQIYEAKLKLSNIDSYTYPYIYDLAFDYLQYYQTIVVYGTYRRTKTIIDNIIMAIGIAKNKSNILLIFFSFYVDFVYNIPFALFWCVYKMQNKNTRFSDVFILHFYLFLN